MVRLVRHRRTKGPDTDRPHLHHRATSRLHKLSTVLRISTDKSACIESSRDLRVAPRGGYSDKSSDSKERYRPTRCSPTEGRFSKPPPQNDLYVAYRKCNCGLPQDSWTFSNPQSNPQFTAPSDSPRPAPQDILPAPRAFHRCLPACTDRASGLSRDASPSPQINRDEMI